MTLYFIIAWVLSIVFSTLIAAGVVTYIRRTWQLIRADSDGSVQSQLLDAMEQVQTQLYSMSERMERLEQGLESGDGEPARELPPGSEESSESP